MIQQATHPGYVDGIISIDPIRLQCRDCGAIHDQCHRSVGACILTSGYKFHVCEGRQGIRRCPGCLAAVIKECPNGSCKV